MLTFQFLRYAEIESLSSEKRISKIIKLLKDEKILVLEGKLKKTEEANLIQKAMEAIGESSDNFKGLELAVIDDANDEKDLLKRLKLKLVDLMLGDRVGLTVIGPASIVTEIKQNKDNLQFIIDNYNAPTPKKTTKSSKKKKSKN